MRSITGRGNSLRLLTTTVFEIPIAAEDGTCPSQKEQRIGTAPRIEEMCSARVRQAYAPATGEQWSRTRKVSAEEKEHWVSISIRSPSAG